MASSSLSGKAQTVLGVVDPTELGVTLTHEHLSLEFDVSFVPINDVDQNRKSREQLPLVMSNLGWIRQNPYHHYPNLRLFDEYDAITDEMKQFKQNGGQTVVENTSIGIRRDFAFLKKLSQETSVNIIAGTGFYVGASHPPDMSSRTIESLAGEISRDLTVGDESTGVRCGIIGELGCSWPLQDNEKKVLRAAAVSQTETGAPVIIHPGRNPTAPAEIIRLFQEAGGDVTQTVMSHIDRTIADRETLLEFAVLGGYCEWDLFGVETSHYMLNSGFDMPSDAQRIQSIRWLVEAGLEDRVVIGHDIHTKHRLTKYGGHGYSHILLNVVPKMRDRGFTEETIQKILVENPRRWLTFK